MYSIPTGPEADAEIITVSSDELPADANEIIEIMKEFTTETWTPPLATYADLAIEYTRRGLLTEAGKMLRAGLDPSELCSGLHEWESRQVVHTRSHLALVVLTCRAGKVR